MCKGAVINLSVSINLMDDVFIRGESPRVFFPLLVLFLGKSNAEATRLSALLLLCVIQLRRRVDQFREGRGQLSHSHEPCIRKQLANEENNESH